MKNNTTQRAESEQEAKALDLAINILVAFTLAAVSFSAGYYVAANEAAAMVKTILTNP